jgi:effector-binding domain-containing protein
MKYEIDIIQATPRSLAVAHTRANSHNVGETIQRLLPQVWEFVKENNITNNGQSLVVYHGEEGTDIFSDEGMPIEIGVQVLESFEASDAIRHFATPGGEVAHTVHAGPYHLLTAAHAAIQHWCLEHKRDMDGLCWEVYGHHHEDPNQQETHVCYLLR